MKICDICDIELYGDGHTHKLGQASSEQVLNFLNAHEVRGWARQHIAKMHGVREPDEEDLPLAQLDKREA